MPALQIKKLALLLMVCVFGVSFGQPNLDIMLKTQNNLPMHHDILYPNGSILPVPYYYYGEAQLRDGTTINGTVKTLNNKIHFSEMFYLEIEGVNVFYHELESFQVNGFEGRVHDSIVLFKTLPGAINGYSEEPLKNSKITYVQIGEDGAIEVPTRENLMPLLQNNPVAEMFTHGQKKRLRSGRMKTIEKPDLRAAIEEYNSEQKWGIIQILENDSLKQNTIQMYEQIIAIKPDYDESYAKKLIHHYKRIDPYKYKHYLQIKLRYFDKVELSMRHTYKKIRKTEGRIHRLEQQAEATASQ